MKSIVNAWALTFTIVLFFSRAVIPRDVTSVKWRDKGVMGITIWGEPPCHSSKSKLNEFTLIISFSCVIPEPQPHSCSFSLKISVATALLVLFFFAVIVTCFIWSIGTLVDLTRPSHHRKELLLFTSGRHARPTIQKYSNVQKKC